MKQVHDRKPHDAAQEDFRKLDALVLAELEALERVSPKQHSVTRPGGTEDGAGDNVIFRGEWSPEQTPRDEPASDASFADETSVPEPQAESRQAPAVDLTFKDSEDPVETDLFTLEEQTFITRITEWLRQRENKDMIMSRIWALVTESEPASFFTAEGNPGPGKSERAGDEVQNDAARGAGDAPQE
ncbi:MAG: hypothetical protein ABF290_06665 [Thiogranum sp.]